MSIETSLYCPIPSRIHPEYERAREDSTAWVLRHGLLGDQISEEAFRSLKIPEFVARAYPAARYADLRVVMDWTMWGFLADDQHDSLVGLPAVLQARYAEHIQILQGSTVALPGGMHEALVDLRSRILKQSGRDCLRRFTASAVHWFASMRTETLNRVEQTSPSLLDYLRLREVSVGMYTEYALLDVTHQVQTDDAFWIEPDVRRLSVMAANIIAWSNDIFSYRKERRAADPHNMVLLLSAEQGMSEADAISRTAQLHNREMVRFVELVTSMRASGWVEPELLEPFVDMASAWIRANLDWAAGSARYETALTIYGGQRTRKPTLTVPRCSQLRVNPSVPGSGSLLVPSEPPPM